MERNASFLRGVTSGADQEVTREYCPDSMTVWCNYAYTLNRTFQVEMEGGVDNTDSVKREPTMRRVLSSA